MRRLRLDRPLVCFDLETTGTDIGRDRAVEIGLVRLEPDGRRTEWDKRLISIMYSLPVFFEKAATEITLARIHAASNTPRAKMMK